MYSSKASSVASQHNTILIVDDQIANIQVLALLLEVEGYSITYALNAKEAQQRLHLIQPDLIFLDLFMPEINGLDLCEQLKADPKYQDIPIIFLTASRDEQHVISAFEKGAADYVKKPFNAKEVIARTATHLQLRQQTIKLRQAKEQLTTIVSHMQDGLLIVDQAGMIQLANPAAAQMLNQPLSSLLGYPLEQPIFDPRVPKIEILRLDNTPGIAEISVAQTEWNNQPATIICLRDISDRLT